MLAVNNVGKFNDNDIVLVKITTLKNPTMLHSVLRIADSEEEAEERVPSPDLTRTNAMLEQIMWNIESLAASQSSLRGSVESLSNQ